MADRPRLLDLFCCAGGAAMGYHQAGFDVVGVDINSAVGRHYPFEFHQGDALTYSTDGFDAIHASPPCQRYSVAVLDKGRHPDLVAATRQRLKESGLPWVIENVAGAPIRPDYLLCGSMFRLPHLIRHRHFEVSWRASVGGGQRLGPGPCRHVEGDRALSVVGRGVPKSAWQNVPHAEAVETARRSMGIDWPMPLPMLSEAIPPAYTKWLGRLLLARVQLARRNTHV